MFGLFIKCFNLDWLRQPKLDFIMYFDYYFTTVMIDWMDSKISKAFMDN